MQDDFDLEGLSREDARSYVAQFIQSLQLAKRGRAEQEQQYDKWKSRARLAVERGEDELAREAIRRAEELQSSLAAVRREERELEFKVTELKRRLTNLQRQPEFTVNAEALLEQLQQVAGADHETTEAIERTAAESEAELALEELRRKMAKESELTEETEDTGDTGETT